MAKFNINRFQTAGGLLNEFSKQATQKLDEMVIVYKSIDELVPNKQNKYSIQSIQELADNIKTVGRIQQPIVYLDPPLEDERNKIIAGHRRYEAYCLLVKEDPKWGENIPCTPVTIEHVNMPISDESKERYLILTTNIDNRNKTDADTMLEYREQKAIYEEAKKNGYALTGKMRHIISNDLGLSQAQVGKYEYVEKNAIEPVKEALMSNNLNISQANEIAHKAVEEQHEIVSKINDVVNNSSPELPASDADKPDIKREVKKAIKPKIIDNLEQDFYTVNLSDQINEIKNRFNDLDQISDSSPSLSKKNYAKLLVTKENIIEQVEKLEKMIKDFSQ